MGHDLEAASGSPTHAPAGAAPPPRVLGVDDRPPEAHHPLAHYARPLAGLSPSMQTGENPDPIFREIPDPFFRLTASVGDEQAAFDGEY